MKRDIRKRTGFTLVELLTAMAVVGILLALLIPALTAVQESAVNVRQKGQFHALGLGLEAFRNDTGAYPPSAYSLNHANYTAAERLAEALIGQDGLGFHPDSTFYQDGFNTAGKHLYRNSPSFNTDWTAAEQQANFDARTGPYLELESANAVQLQSIYGTRLSVLSPNSFVLVDMFGKVKHLSTGKQIGMPILYYRADKTKLGHDGTSVAAMEASTYNAGDAIFTQVGASPIEEGIVSQEIPFRVSVTEHPLKTNYKTFYDATLNPNFTAQPRPYRAESFLLHSAGRDGLYGTMDDVFNFDSGK